MRIQLLLILMILPGVYAICEDTKMFQFGDASSLPKVGDELEITMPEEKGKNQLENIFVREKHLEIPEGSVFLTFTLENPWLTSERREVLGEYPELYKIFQEGNSLTAYLSVSNGYAKDSLYEGETRTYTLHDKRYEVKLLIVADTSSTAKFIVNGEHTEQIHEGGKDTLNDGSIIEVLDIGYNEGTEEEGGDSVLFSIMNPLGFIIINDPDVTQKTFSGTAVWRGVNIRSLDFDLSGDETQLSIFSYRAAADDAIVLQEGESLRKKLEIPEILGNADVMYAFHEVGPYVYYGRGSPPKCSYTAPICGDGRCVPNENCEADSCCSGAISRLEFDNSNCGVCGKACGDHEYCEAGTCIKELYCGDGICNENENCQSCDDDCGCASTMRCENKACVNFCGNNNCDPGEEYTCRSDCDWCGDGECQEEENCGLCTEDCGCASAERCESNACTTYCGNSICESTESCSSCNKDCACNVQFEQQEINVLDGNVQIPGYEVVHTTQVTETQYEIETVNEGKILGLFSTDLQSTLVMDLNSQKIEVVKKPWWSFLVW